MCSSLNLRILFGQYYHELPFRNTSRKYYHRHSDNSNRIRIVCVGAAKLKQTIKYKNLFYVHIFSRYQCNDDLIPAVFKSENNTFLILFPMKFAHATHYTRLGSVRFFSH